MKYLLFCAALAIGLGAVAVGQDLRVARRDGLYGYIDRTGTWVIEPSFIEATDWENGVARVLLADGSTTFIDAQGNYLMRPRKFARVGDLSEGVASFEMISEHAPNNVGFVDVKGRVVIPPRFQVAYEFTEGVAAASLDSGKCGYIDKSGKFLIPPVFELAGYHSCGAFSEGLAHAIKGGKHGYINHKGTFVIPPIYDYAFDFSEGFAVVGLGDKYGYVDKHGTILGGLSYSYARQFSEGLAPVAFDKWGFIDKSGKLVIPAKYDEVGDFSEGLAWVQVNSKLGYINSYGDLVVPLQFDAADNFWNGMADVVQRSVSDKGATSIRIVIDKTGASVRFETEDLGEQPAPPIF